MDVGEAVNGPLPGDGAGGTDDGPVEPMDVLLDDVVVSFVAGGRPGPEPLAWVVIPPAHVLATQIGTFPPAGVFLAAAGATLTEPIWTVPSDPSTACGSLPPLASVVVLEPPGLCVEFPPAHVLSTQTGTLPSIGALPDAAGFTATEPTCTVTAEWFTSCDPPPPLALVVAPVPPELCVELPPLQSLATHTGALAVTGAFPEIAGLTPTEPTCADPTEWVTSCDPFPPDELVVAPVPPDACVELPPAQVLSTHTGTLPLIGAFPETAGLAPTGPTCADPSELLTSCGPPPLPAELLVEPLPPELCVELPPVQSLATHTGALAVTGAFPEIAGLTPAEPTCADPTEWVTSCDPFPPDELVVLPAPLDACVELLPLQVLATHTGALAFAGALAETDGFAPAALACTVAADSFTVCSPELGEPDAEDALESPPD